MARSTSYAIKMTAVDHVSATIARINKRLADMQRPVVRLKKTLSQFAELSGFRRISMAFSRIAHSALEAFRSVTRMLPVVSTLVGAASIAGLERLAEAFGNSGTHAKVLAASLGMPVKQLSVMENMLRTSGGSAEEMDAALSGLQATMAGVARNDPAFMQQRMLLEKQGINPVKAGFFAKSPDIDTTMSILRFARDHFPAAPASEMRYLKQMLGPGANADVMRLANRSNAEQDEIKKQVLAHGPLTDEQATIGDRLRQSITSLTESFEGVGNSIMTSVAPPLTKLLTQISTYVDDNRQLITVQVKTWLDEAGASLLKFGKYLSTVDWKSYLDSARQTVDATNKLVAQFGGWKDVLTAIVAIRIAAWVAGIVTALGPLGIALAGIVAAFESMKSFGRKGGGGDPATWDANSPFWRGMSERDQSNYVNSPRSQAFLNPNGTNPNPYHSWNPGSNGWVTHMWDKVKGLFVPRGIRNNNPTNLSFVPGQGAIGSDGRFGIYQDVQSGIAAATRQLLRYQDRDHLNTIRGIVTKWAPPGENDTAAYINDVARQLGVAPDTPLDLHNQQTATDLVMAISRHEGDAIDRKVASEGVGMVLGPGPRRLAEAPDAPAAKPKITVPNTSATHKITGDVRVNVSLAGAPDATATATATGDAFGAPPRIAVAGAAS